MVTWRRNKVCTRVRHEFVSCVLYFFRFISRNFLLINSLASDIPFKWNSIFNILYVSGEIFLHSQWKSSHFFHCQNIFEGEKNLSLRHFRERGWRLRIFFFNAKLMIRFRKAQWNEMSQGKPHYQLSINISHIDHFNFLGKNVPSELIFKTYNLFSACNFVIEDNDIQIVTIERQVSNRSSIHCS